MCRLCLAERDDAVRSLVDVVLGVLRRPNWLQSVKMLKNSKGDLLRIRVGLRSGGLRVLDKWTNRKNSHRLVMNEEKIAQVVRLRLRYYVAKASQGSLAD